MTAAPGRKELELEQEVVKVCTAKLMDNPANAAALVRRGHAYLRQGLLEQALQDAKDACCITPTSADALYLCGSVHVKQHELDKAIELFSLVLELQPGHSKAALSRGACRNMQGDIARALDDYALALAHKDIQQAHPSKGHHRRLVLPAEAGSAGQHASSQESPASSSSVTDAHRREWSVSPHAPAAMQQQQAQPLLAAAGAAAGVTPLTATQAPRSHALPVSSVASRGTPATLPGSDSKSSTLGSSVQGQSRERDTDSVPDRSRLSRRTTMELHIQPCPLVAGFSACNTPEAGMGELLPPGLHRKLPIPVSTSSALPTPPTSGPSLPNGESAGTMLLADAAGVGLSAAVASKGIDPALRVLCSPRMLLCEAGEEEAGRAVPARVAADVVQADGAQPSSSGHGDRQAAAQHRAHGTAQQHLARAFALRRQGDHRGAVQEYSRALALNPDDFRALFNRAFTHDKLGDHAAAIADYTRAIEIEPRSVAYFNRGIAKDRMGDLQGALADFTSCIDLDPGCADAFHCKGCAHRKVGALEAAIADFSRAIALNPQHSRAHYHRGITLEGLELLEEALQDYEKAILLDATNITALHSRGSLHQRLGHPLQALADYNAAVALLGASGAGATDASCAFIFNSRGVLLQAMGQLSQALPDFDAAVRLAPSTAAFKRNRGQCRRATGDLAGAIVDFTQAIQQDPSDMMAHVQRAHSFRRIKEFEAAIRDYTVAIQGIQKSGAQVNVSLYNHRAYALAKVGCWVEACNDYTCVLEGDPQNAHAKYNRALALEKLGLTDM